MTERQHHHEPITPKRAGAFPGFVVSCLDCAFSHDAHGLSAEDAVKALAPTHQAGHRLYAVPVDYSTHPLYQYRRR